MNPWTIPTLVLAAGWGWYIYEHQKAPATDPNEDPESQNYKPGGGFFYPAGKSRKWHRPGKILAINVIPKQPPEPGTAVGWFVECQDGVLMEAYGSTRQIMNKVQLVKPVK